MSEFVAAVSQKLAGVPEELIMRSANARAAAQGISADDVLAAWAGGAVIESAPASAATVDSPPVATEVAAPATAPAAEPDTAVEPAVEAAPAAPVGGLSPAASPVLVAEEEEEEEVEPAAIAQRLRFGVAVGAATGAILGVIGMVLAAPLMVDRASVVGEGNEAAIAVTSLATIITIAVTSAVFGAIVSTLARSIPGYTDKAFAVRGTARGSAILGAVVGLALGFIAGGVLIATGEEALSGDVLLSVRSGLLVILLGGGVLGAVVGGVAQLVGVPAAKLDEGEEAVRTRISNAIMVPAVAAIAILGFVVPLGVILVSFHEFASVIALVIAALILTFSFLMASRPNLRISRGEFLMAAAGVGVALLLLAAIASQLAGDDHGEEDHSEPEAAAAIRLL
jgi:hypothetical protein